MAGVVDESRPPSVYVGCLYASGLMLAGGQGTIAAENVPEYVLMSFAVLVGSLLWAVVQGTICAAMSTGNPAEAE